MLKQLAQNQYVKITRPGRTEYGVVTNINKSEDGEENIYDIMSIGFENKNGAFLTYPPNTEFMNHSYSINDAQFDEVKRHQVRREMSNWMDKYFKMFARHNRMH